MFFVLRQSFEFNSFKCSKVFNRIYSRLEKMSRKGNYAEYKSPNIVIVPTVSYYQHSPAKKTKLETNYSCVTKYNIPTLKATTKSHQDKTESNEVNNIRSTSNLLESTRLTNIHNATFQMSKNVEGGKLDITGLNKSYNIVQPYSDRRENIIQHGACKLDTKSKQSCDFKIPLESNNLRTQELKHKSVKSDKTVSKSCDTTTPNMNSNEKIKASKEQTPGKFETASDKSCKSKTPIKPNNSRIQESSLKHGASKLDAKSVYKTCDSKTLYLKLKLKNEKMQELSMKQAADKTIHKSYIHKSSKLKPPDSSKINSEIPQGKCDKTVIGVKKVRGSTSSGKTKACMKEPEKRVKFIKAEGLKSTIFADKNKQQLKKDNTTASGHSNASSVPIKSQKLDKSGNLASSSSGNKSKERLVTIESNKVEKDMGVAKQPNFKSTRSETINNLMTKENRETSTSWASNFMQSVGQISKNKKRAKIKPTTENICDSKIQNTKSKTSPQKHVRKADIRSISKKSPNTKSKRKKYKKIMLNLTVMFNQPINTDNNDDEDISFLEDINVDEIVNSLYEKPLKEQETTQKEVDCITPSSKLKIEASDHFMQDPKQNIPLLEDNITKEGSHHYNKENKLMKSDVKAKDKVPAACSQSTLPQLEKNIAPVEDNITKVCSQNKHEENKVIKSDVKSMDKKVDSVCSHSTLPQLEETIVPLEDNITKETGSQHNHEENKVIKSDIKEKDKKMDYVCPHSTLPQLEKNIAPVEDNITKEVCSQNNYEENKVIKSDIQEKDKKMDSACPYSTLPQLKKNVDSLEDNIIKEVGSQNNHEEKKVMKSVVKAMDKKADAACPPSTLPQSEKNMAPLKDNIMKEVGSQLNNEEKKLMKSVVKSMDKQVNAICPRGTLSQSEKAIAKKLEFRMFKYLNKNFTISHVIRKGRYSRIYHCKDSNNKEYAVKVLNNGVDRYNLGIRKENMLMKLQREIPRENLTFVYIHNGFALSRLWCFLMDYYPKNLQEALLETNTPFHIDLVQHLARQLVSAVTMLRNNYIVHSDIKPAHILLTQCKDKLKLCGFDSAYYNAFSTSLLYIGSVNYRAPEVILGYSASYSIDVWSTALVMHEMATGTKLFPGIYNNEILYQQMSILGEIPIDMRQKCMFKEAHFIGTRFMRKSGYKGKEIIMVNNFAKTDKLRSSLNSAYIANWATRTEAEQKEDMIKINLLCNLLEQMFILHPNNRLPIEFVYANPFIYEAFDV